MYSAIVNFHFASFIAHKNVENFGIVGIIKSQWDTWKTKIYVKLYAFVTALKSGLLIINIFFIWQDENHRCEEREWIGLSYRVHYFDFVVNDEKYLIWGLTASILIRCASIVYQRSPEFVDSPAFVPITNHVPIQSSHG